MVNALEDKTLSREGLKGFYTFLHSESLRHAQDIRDIKDRMYEVSKRIQMTPEERAYLKKEGLKYVKF